MDQHQKALLRREETLSATLLRRVENTSADCAGWK